MPHSNLNSHLTLRQVLNVTGFTRAALAEKTEHEDFPRALPRGPWHTAWVSRDVERWLDGHRDERGTAND